MSAVVGSSIVIKNAEILEPQAAHFGVSADNFLSSVPTIGMQAVEMAHSGLVFVGHRPRGLTRPELQARELFEDAYRGPSRGKSRYSEHEGRTIKAFVPESVQDFCKERNISTLAVSRVGLQLLSFATYEGASIGVGLDVYAKRCPGKRGVLDSRLAFSVSSINTIIMTRNKANISDRLGAKFGRK